MIPVLVLGVPILDTSLVIISRLRRGYNPFTTAGKDHVSHRLVYLGFTRREAVLMIYILGGAYGMLAIFITEASIVQALVVAAAAFLASAFIIWRMERVPLAGREAPDPR